MRIIKIFLLWVLVGAASLSQAHMLNMTEMRFEVAEGAPAVLRVRVDLGQSGLMNPDAYWAAVNASSAAEQDERLKPALAEMTVGLQVLVEGEPTTMFVQSYDVDAVSLEAIGNPLTPQMAEVRFGFTGPQPVYLDQVEIRVAQTLDVPWPCLVRIDSFDGLPVSRLLTAETRSSGPVVLGVDGGLSNAGPLVSLALKFQAVLPSVSWIAIGFQHIIPMGLDHIVFILGLFFLSTKLTTLIAQVTAFTAAHSLTLALATLGWVQVSPHIVEPLVAASIVYVAIDNLYAVQVARWRLAVVLIFGLLHGLGFASALDAVTLPEESMISALLFFNLGVEIGQVAVLLLAYLSVGWLRRWSFYRTRVVEPASVTIAGIGLYWLVKRLAF
ncbi:MAG: HupE/UreJ family protein [Proteobacteria bacterium]|nr:HupE/UreJ family protein [Pseudomonadota bacterium]